MNVRAAEDFLVNQTVQLAASEAVALSDLEKRMMNYSENDETCEDPIALDDEFETQFQTEEYEPKISLLLQHAYRSVEKESPGLAR